jgi:hypothetical protein
MVFSSQSLPIGDSVSELDAPLVHQQTNTGPDEKFPPAIMKLPDEDMQKFVIWLDQWLEDLTSMHSRKIDDWVKQEIGYRALPGPNTTKPYIGADTTTIPAIAMAVDPIHARLDTGIFKQSPVFTIKMLKKSFAKYTDAVNSWVDYYQRHKLQLRRIASPRLLEATKLGTCIFKTVYDREEYTVKTYDPKNEWKVIERKELRFAGPRVFGISVNDFLFPPSFQFLQDCPIVAERQRTTYNQLKIAEASKKLANVDAVKDQVTRVRTALETERENQAGHVTTNHRWQDEIEVHEFWCDYDINGDGLPERLVGTFHRDTRTILQLRFNWYFHQRKPYTVIPYSITNDSLYGIGIAEMVLPFQDALTKWHRMATDNAYLANIRMFIVKKGSGIEEVPRLYSGRCFFVDDPKSDFIPFAVGDIYPSTLSERQNIFGLVEKRTGVSDYLTGRESPIIGSRATATSTLALIQEGTKRVEEVLENIRHGLAEVLENCFYIWIQYGLEGLEDVVFGDDQIGDLVKEFFNSLSAENINGALAVDLTATDAAGSRQAMQQMQLQIIQIMMGYLEKLLAAGQGVLMAQQQMPQIAPEFAGMVTDVLVASRKMFRDLLTKYEVPNPEEYLPDITKYLQGGAADAAAAGPGGSPNMGGGAQGPTGTPQFPVVSQSPPGIQVPRPATPGSGGFPANPVALAG